MSAERSPLLTPEDVRRLELQLALVLQEEPPSARALDRRLGLISELIQAVRADERARIRQAIERAGYDWLKVEVQLTAGTEGDG